VDEEIEKLRSVVRPEDDNPVKVQAAIDLLMKRNAAHVYQLSDELHIVPNSTNELMRVVSFCYQTNEFLWLLNPRVNNQPLVKDKNEDEDFFPPSEKEDLTSCIELMKRIQPHNIESKMKFIGLAYYIGLEYRRVRMEVD